MNSTHKLLFLSLFFIGLFFSYSNAYSQEKIASNNILVVFYNVENLFDTIDDPHKNDNEFLPSSKKAWTSKRYYDKINNLSLVLSSINKRKAPDLIGLCEVENKAVIQDLASSANLQKGKYDIIHFESPDARSIDVALLVKPSQFKIIASRPLNVSLPGNNIFKTRDILFVKLYHKKSKDTLYVFVNHWPSRLGGEEKSRDKRIAAASVVKNMTDSLFNKGINPKIIIMGDLNDEPNEVSTRNILAAVPADTLTNKSTFLLYNLSYPPFNNGKGSYYYSKDKKWNMIDNMIVSNELIVATHGLKAQNYSVNIYAPDWILFTHENGLKTPSKTYGKDYLGGFSDHLPIYQYFIFTK